MSHPRPRRSRCLGWAGLALLALLCPVSPGWAEGEEGTPLDRYFKGKVESFDDGVLRLRYDFESKDQMQDWFEGVPFPIRRRKPPVVEVADGKLRIVGSSGAQHVAVWTHEVEVTCTLKLVSTRDVGGMLVPHSGEHDFATFTVREFFFHSWDRGQKGGQHSIIKFGDQWRESGFNDEFIGFRYVTRKKPSKELEAGQSLPFTFGLRREKLFMVFPGVKLKGKDLGTPLDLYHPGFYVAKGEVKIEEVTIEGRLDEAWMRACGVAPRLAPSDGDED